MDVMLIKAIDAYFIFDHQAEQRDVLDHLRDVLHVSESDARHALAELIAADVLRVMPVRMQSRSSSSIRTRALVMPGPRLHELATPTAD